MCGDESWCDANDRKAQLKRSARVTYAWLVNVHASICFDEVSAIIGTRSKGGVWEISGVGSAAPDDGGELLSEQIICHLNTFRRSSDDDFSITRALKKVVSITHFNATSARHLHLGDRSPTASEDGADERIGNGDKNRCLIAASPSRATSIEFTASSATTALRGERRLHAVRALSMHERAIGRILR